MDVATVLRATNARVMRITDAGEAAPGNLSVADLQRAVEVSIDSRSTFPDALFVALRGERVDGHDFVTDALARGALGCMVSRVPTGELPVASRETPTYGPRLLFLVPDPLNALQQLAAYWRLHHSADVVGITGSVGKTTTKEILAAVLAPARPVLRSEANLNTEIGLPLTLLRLTSEHRVAVLEMGMHARGDIALLARIARPRVGVVTNVAPVHLERMGTIERIAHEKSELIAALPAHGLAVLNGDDPWTRAMATASGVAPVCLVGLGPDCDFQALDIAPDGLDGLSFTMQAEGSRFAVRTRVPGAHTAHAFLTAAAVAREGGLEWDEILAAIEGVRLQSRQSIVRGAGDMVIIDDTYNASPLSMEAALNLLSSARGTKMAVLGDMLELGPMEEQAHREVGERAAEVAEWLIVRGGRGRWIAEGAEHHGFPADRVRRVDSNAEAARAVLDIMGIPIDQRVGPVSREAESTLGSNDPRTMTSRRAVGRVLTGPAGGPSPLLAEAQPGWTVLVKGSRGMKMEEVVHALRGEV